MKSKPSPGSPEAIGLGCECAIIDNGHGKGCGWKDDNGDPVFFITMDCPIHGGKDE